MAAACCSVRADAEATKVSKGFSTPKTVDLTPRRHGFDGQQRPSLERWNMTSRFYADCEAAKYLLLNTHVL